MGLPREYEDDLGTGCFDAYLYDATLVSTMLSDYSINQERVHLKSSQFPIGPNGLQSVNSNFFTTFQADYFTSPRFVTTISKGGYSTVLTDKVYLIHKFIVCEETPQ